MDWNLEMKLFQHGRELAPLTSVHAHVKIEMELKWNCCNMDQDRFFPGYCTASLLNIVHHSNRHCKILQHYIFLCHVPHFIIPCSIKHDIVFEALSLKFIVMI